MKAVEKLSFTCKYCKWCFGESVPRTYLIRIEFSLMDKMKFIPSNESYGKLVPCGTIYYVLQNVLNCADRALGVRTCNQMWAFLLSILPE